MKDLLRTKFLQPQQRKKITNNTQSPNPYYYPWNDLQDLFSVFFNPLRNYSSQMGKRRYGFLLILSFVAILGLISFLSCLAAELKRTKVLFHFQTFNISICVPSVFSEYYKKRFIQFYLLIFFWQKKDLKLYGRFCYLPKSRAFRFGIVALICFVIAQIIGNLIVILYLCSKDKRRNDKLKNKQNIFFIPLLVISW